jgi:hypothetical protein
MATIEEQKKYLIDRQKRKGYSDQDALLYANEIMQQSAPEQEVDIESGNNILKTLLQNAGSALVTRPVSRATEAVTRLAFPNSLAAQGYEQMADAGESQHILGTEVKAVKAFGQGGGSQLVGETLESASYLPFGRAIGMTGKLLTNPTARGLVQISGESAVGGLLDSSGRQLQETGTVDPWRTAGDTITAGAFGLGFGVAGNTAGRAYRASGRGITSLADMIKSSKVGAGVSQITEEIGERFPRAVKRGQEAITEAAGRKERIATSTPAVARAIKSDIDEPLIQQITAAKQPSVKLVMDSVEIMDDPLRKGATALDPIAEEAVVLYKTVADKLDEIGGGYDVELAKLPTGTKAVDLYNKLDTKLQKAGITQTYDPKNPLKFPSGIGPAQRTAISKLYNEVTRLGDDITPLDVKKLQSVVTTLKRESKVVDGLADIYVEIDGKPTNIYQLFSDTMSQQLDTYNPKIRELNKEYGKYIRFKQDLEKTIFKDSQNLDSLKGEIGLDSFVPNAIRRVFSNAQSAGNYKGMLRKLQTEAEELGYKGANLEEAADIIISLQKNYFPEGIQKTSLEGAVQPPKSIMDVVDRATSIGKLNEKDKQKAIKDMLDEILK